MSSSVPANRPANRPKKPLRRQLLLLTKYPDSVASSRIRWLDHVSYFEECGFQVRVCPLLGMSLRKYGSAVSFMRTLGDTAAQAPLWAMRLWALMRRGVPDVVVAQKALLPILELRLLQWARRRGALVVFDLDDAEYTLSRRRCRNTEKAARTADIAIGGSRSIVKWFDSLGVSGRLLHTPAPVTDIVRCSALEPVVAWTGSPVSAPNLRLVMAAMEVVRSQVPHVRVIVMGAGQFPDCPKWWEQVDWTPEGESSLLRTSSIGIMPLEDTPLNRGKCSYKALLYAGAGLPVAMSPVGMNVEVLQLGIGRAANSTEEWADRIVTALLDPSAAFEEGNANREVVRRSFSIAAYRVALGRVLRVQERGGQAGCTLAAPDG
jgi:glycosyltransferase involved in cell wall biosynthesis